jgi:3-oxoacyl-[acyl-carrier protein] reductase
MSMNGTEGVVLVSGGSRGLGLSIIDALLEEGRSVVTFSRKSTEAISSIQRQNSRLTFMTADMEDAESLSRVVKDTEKQIGPIDALVNNAGVALDGVLATMPEADIEKVININLVGTLRLTRQAVRRMIVRRRGCIVNISSIIGLRGYSGLAVYSASKGGMDAMTRALARELGDRNIRVNSIAPGYLETEMTHGLSEQQKGQIVRRTPLGRLGQPRDVTGAVSFLLSDAAAFITGQTLTIDGGITC